MDSWKCLILHSDWRVWLHWFKELPLTSQWRIMRFNLSKLASIGVMIRLIWLFPSRIMEKWNIAHLDPFLQPYLESFLAQKNWLYLSDDVTFQRWPINTCFVVWRTLWLMSYLLAFSSTFQNCIFLIWSFAEINKVKAYALQISRTPNCIHLARSYQLQIDKETLHRNYIFLISVKVSKK